jgi:hypothetical protein
MIGFIVNNGSGKGFYVLSLHLKFVVSRNSVIASVLTSSAVNRGFEPRLGQTKDYEIGICCFSAKHTTLRRIRIMYLSDATCLSADCCFSNLVDLLLNTTKRVGLVQSGPHHNLIDD